MSDLTYSPDQIEYCTNLLAQSSKHLTMGAGIGAGAIIIILIVVICCCLSMISSSLAGWWVYKKEEEGA